MIDVCEKGKSLWILIGNVIGIIRIAIPIIIILLGSLDLGKAVIAGEEKQVKEAQGTFIKRIIYGIVVFFVVTIVQLVFGLVGDTTQGDKATTSQCFCYMEKGIAFNNGDGCN